MNVFLTAQQVEWLAMTLLHSLWQGAVIAFFLVSVLRLIPASRANLRYAFSSAALVALPISTLATWWWLNLRILAHPTNTSAAAGNPVVESLPDSGNDWQSMLVWFWMLGAAVMIIRLIVSCCRIHRLRNDAVTPDASLLAIFAPLAKARNISQSVRILTTERLTTAAVAGIFRPVLLIPAAMATGLSARQLEAVIAHELEHIRRFDALANFLQMLVEAALFFNPAIWWISRQVRIEREACCDAAGVEASGDAGFYSATLADWAEHLQRVNPSALPAGAIAFAAKEKSTLLARIRRILFPDDVPRSHFSPLSTVFLFCFGLVVFGGLWKGTQVAVAFVDDILPHEAVVKSLTEERKKFGRPRLPIEKPVAEIHQHGFDLEIEVLTPDGQPTTSRVDISYTTFRRVENSTHSASGSLGTLAVAQMNKTFPVEFGWAHLMFNSAEFAPVVVRDVRPNQSGKAFVRVKFTAGFDGVVQVVDENGQPIPKAEFTLNHVLRSTSKSQSSRTLRTTSARSVGTQAGKFTADENGNVTVPRVHNEPMFSAKVRAAGYEMLEIPEFKWTKGTVHKVALQKALPVSGRVIDRRGKPISNVKIYEIESRSLQEKHRSRSTGNSRFCKKEFENPIATTDENGAFQIRNFNRNWQYILLADAGFRGCQTILWIQPGDEPVEVSIVRPVSIRGNVSGAIDRLTKNGEDYELRYGLSLLDDSSRRDASGHIPLKFEFGKLTFKLKNVVPGRYEFFGNGSQRFVRNLEVTDSIPDLKIVVPEAKPKTKTSTMERLVRLKFVPATGVSQFRGRISVSSRSKNSSRYFHRPIDVTDDEVEFAVNAPTKIDVEMMDAPGFLFKNAEDFQFEVKADSPETFRQSITVHPAGAIYGQLKRPESALNDAWLGVVGWTKFKTKTTFRRQSTSQQCDEQGRFFLDHLNYGSETVLLARCGAWCQPLKPIRIDADNPQAQINLKIGEGRQLQGRLTNSEGKPVRNMPIALKLFTGEYDKHSLGKVTTDNDGRYTFGAINPQAGEHFVTIAPGKIYAPIFQAVDGKTECDIVLQSGGIVEGQLVDAKNGQPVPGVEVYASLRKFRPQAVYACEAEKKTDAKGFFRFSNLGDEAYQLNTRAVGRLAENTFVRSGDRNVKLQLKPRE